MHLFQNHLFPLQCRLKHYSASPVNVASSNPWSSNPIIESSNLLSIPAEKLLSTWNITFLPPPLPSGYENFPHVSIEV